MRTVDVDVSGTCFSSTSGPHESTARSTSDAHYRDDTLVGCRARDLSFPRTVRASRRHIFRRGSRMPSTPSARAAAAAVGGSRRSSRSPATAATAGCGCWGAFCSLRRDAPEADRFTNIRGWRSFISVPVRDSEVVVTAGTRRHVVRADRGGVLDVRVEADLEPGWQHVDGHRRGSAARHHPGVRGRVRTCGSASSRTSTTPSW